MAVDGTRPTGPGSASGDLTRVLAERDKHEVRMARRAIDETQIQLRPRVLDSVPIRYER
jgi:hypothetical protein